MTTETNALITDPPAPAIGDLGSLRNAINVFKGDRTNQEIAGVLGVYKSDLTKILVYNLEPSKRVLIQLARNPYLAPAVRDYMGMPEGDMPELRE
jgi:hypothetical protein